MMRTRYLHLAAAAALLAQTYLALVVAPPAAGFNAPLTQRIFYYHVPAAWAGYLAFAVTAAASIMVLRRDSTRADAVALASAEVGLVMALIALFTGLIWARQEFVGYTPLTDPKVISLGVLILAYAAYLVLREQIGHAPRRRRLAAVVGALSLVGVPFSYLASRASVHPDFTRPEQSLDATLGAILLASTIAFTIVYASLVAARYRLALLEQEVADGN